MSNLVCKDCKSTDVTEYTPGMFGESRHRCNSCGKISATEDFVELTVFDRITASPEVLAPKLVYWTLIEYDGKIHTHWMSTITGEVIYDSEPEAIAATVEKLKDV